MHDMNATQEKPKLPPLTPSQQADLIRRLNTSSIAYEECGTEVDKILQILVNHYKTNRQWIDTQLMRHSQEIRGRFLDLLRKARNATNILPG